MPTALAAVVDERYHERPYSERNFELEVEAPAMTAG
jgi:hypothetical protein